MPPFSARRPAAWIAGPSAIGSVKGMPISMMSAPAFGSALMMSSEVAGSGSPAIRKVMKAERPCFFSSVKRASMRVVILRCHLCYTSPRWGEVGCAPFSLLPPQNVRHLRNILVSAAGEIDHHQMIFRPLRRELRHLGDGMRRFERRNDAFQPRQQLKCGERLVVGRAEIGDAPHLVQPGMLRPYAGIIQSPRNRMRILDLAVVVHQKV